MPTRPTAKQQQVLDYIAEYIEQWGSSPTYREIGAALGISVGAVQHFIDALEARGLLTKNMNEARSIELTRGK